MQIYKRKFFGRSAKKEFFWTKLIFETKEQDKLFDKFMIRFEGRAYEPP